MRQDNLKCGHPPPQVLFLSFGESSLDFELRVWMLDAEVSIFFMEPILQ
jgi:hypothetical protein